MTLNVSAARGLVALIRKCGIEMRQNAAYIKGELPNLACGEDLKRQIGSICELLDRNGTEYINEAEEFGHYIESGSPVVRLVASANRILSNIQADLQKVHVLVKLLESSADSNLQEGIAYTLVAESAVNVLKAYQAAAEAAGHLVDRDGSVG